MTQPDVQSADVVIVGGGPTGLMLANILGKAGIDTMVFEANPATVGEPRAVSIDDETLRLVQNVGLSEPVERDIVHGYGSNYVSPSGRTFLKVKPTAQPYGHPRRNAFRQPLFEASLRDGLERYPCVRAEFDARVENVRQDADGVNAHIIRRDGSMIEIRCQYLIGCDGARSTIRDAIGSTLAGDSLDERWLIVDLEDSPTASPETTVFCDVRRPGIALPGPHHTRRYEFKVLPGEDESQLLTEPSIAQLLESHGTARGSRIVRKVIYHFHARIADVWGNRRIWLAGDAAHLMPPFAGQGMNSGMRDAANLGWKLIEVIRGRLGPGLLDTYPLERRGHVNEMIGLAMRMGRIFAPRTRWHGLATRSAFTLLGLWPAARDYFAEMRYKPAPRFKQGFLIDDQDGKPGPVGRMIPQPRLACGDLLDDRLGNGFALLGVDLAQSAVDSIDLGPSGNSLIDCRTTVLSSEASALSTSSGKFVILRPDRYVMAFFAPEETSRIKTQVAKLIERSRKV